VQDLDAPHSPSPGRVRPQRHPGSTAGGEEILVSVPSSTQLDPPLLTPAHNERRQSDTAGAASPPQDKNVPASARRETDTGVAADLAELIDPDSAPQPRPGGHGRTPVFRSAASMTLPTKPLRSTPAEEGGNEEEEEGLGGSRRPQWPADSPHAGPKSQQYVSPQLRSDISGASPPKP